MEDPHRTTKGNFSHSLTDILFLVLSAVMSGADDWETVILFGKSQITWLKNTVHMDILMMLTPKEINIQEDLDHGRIENRTCSVYSNLTHLQNKDKWVGLKTIVRIQAQVI